MQRGFIWACVIGLVLGAAAATAFWSRISPRASVPKGSAVLREFSLGQLGVKSGETNWQVLEDRIYEPFPPLAASKRLPAV
jgi:hypothetical protein